MLFIKKAMSKISAGTVYIFLFLNYLILNNHIKNKLIIKYVDYILTVEYGIAWGVGICGLLINNLFYHKILEKYKIYKWMLPITDIFSHIIPLILIYYYAPKTSNLNFTTITFIYLMLYLLYYLAVGEFSQVYVGVPKLVIYGLFPLIIILSTYIKYFSKSI